MHLFAALVGAVAALAGPAIARALPEAEVVAVASPQVTHNASTEAAIVKRSTQVPNVAAETSAESFYCGYIYSGRGLRGHVTALVAGAGFATLAKSYIVSGECRCLFQFANDHPLQVKGPTQGDLPTTAVVTRCTQEGSTKRDETKEPPAPAPADEQTTYCGYAYSSEGLRGDKIDLALDVSVHLLWMSSYIISGECRCVFKNSLEMPGAEIVIGPTQGNLHHRASSVFCDVDDSLRDKAKELAASTRAQSAVGRSKTVEGQ